MARIVTVNSTNACNLMRHFQLKSFHILIIGVTCISIASGQTPKATKSFEWYKKNYIIQNPSFAHSDSEIVFVRKFYIPDGHDAEGREQYAESLLSKADKEKRFADPVVCLLNVKTKKLTQVDYGWTPKFSPDDKRIVYSYQAIPISGKRVLAATLNGNTIKIYNRLFKQYKTVAFPDKTFLLDPIFLDSSTVIYKIGNAVNGAYPGGVAFNKINLMTKKIETLYPVKKNHGLFNLVGDIYQNGERAYYVVYIPQDSASWMANNYSHLLFASSRIVHDFGKSSFKNLQGKYAVDKEGNLLVIDDDHEFTADKNVFVKYKGNNVVFKKELTFEYHKVSLSPNGQFLLYYNYDNNIFLMRTDTFKKIKLTLPETDVYSIEWSNKSDKFAIVQAHEKYQDTDLITLFDVN
jgi:WD40 repeat protein